MSVAMSDEVVDHDFYPGDHAVIEDDHLCHECGRSKSEHCVTQTEADDSALRAAHMALNEHARSAENAIEQTWRPEVKALRAENEQWRVDWTNMQAENERLKATLEKWRPAVERAVKWSEQLGNERDAKGFAAMLADFDSALNPA